MIKKMTKLTIVLLWSNILSVYAKDESTKIGGGNEMSNKLNESADSNIVMPYYVNIDIFNPEAAANTSIRIPSSHVKFPLTEQDKKDIEILIKKFDNEIDCAGLAAPQIGIPKRIIVFVVPDEPGLKESRTDLVKFMPKTLWINPSYKAIGTEKNEDFEGCFSVYGVAGSVNRYKKISYTAFDREGKIVEGHAEGYAARVIQHEVDHLNGRLFIDLVPIDKLEHIPNFPMMSQNETRN